MVLFPREMKQGDSYYNRPAQAYLRIRNIEPAAGNQVKITHEDERFPPTFLNVEVQFNVRPER